MALLFHESRALSFPRKGTFSPGTKSEGALAPNAPPPGSAASVSIHSRSFVAHGLSMKQNIDETCHFKISIQSMKKRLKDGKDFMKNSP